MEVNVAAQQLVEAIGWRQDVKQVECSAYGRLLDISTVLEHIHDEVGQAA